MPTARVVSCKPAAKYDDRSVEFEGRMKGSVGQALEMKFSLYSKAPKKRRFSRAKLPGLDQWQRAGDPKATVFRFRQVVRSLQSPALYRAVIRFRWIDSNGKTVRKVNRTTSVCKMNAPAPDLRVEGIDVSGPAADGSSTYFVFISNKGAGEARNVRLWVRRPDTLFGTETIPAIEPGGSQIVSFVGMPCKRWVEAEIDPMNEAGDSNRSNNVLRKDCV